MTKICRACGGPVCTVCGGCIAEGECECIAAARTDVPALIAEVERLQADNERLGAGWFKYATITNGEVHPSGAALLRELEEAQAEIQTLEAELDALRSELGMSK